MNDLAGTTTETPLFVAASQIDFTQPVLLHHFDELLQPIKIKGSLPGGVCF